MSTAVKKTISLPPALSKELDELAREEGKTVSAVIQEALRTAKRERLKQSFLLRKAIGPRKPEKKGSSPNETFANIWLKGESGF